MATKKVTHSMTSESDILQHNINMMFSIVAPDEFFKEHIVGRQLKFTFIPRQCHVTKRTIWLKDAYCVTSMYREGDIQFVKQVRWYEKNEYLIARLKDLI